MLRRSFFSKRQMFIIYWILKNAPTALSSEWHPKVTLEQSFSFKVCSKHFGRFSLVYNLMSIAVEKLAKPQTESLETQFIFYKALIQQLVYVICPWLVLILVWCNIWLKQQKLENLLFGIFRLFGHGSGVFGSHISKYCIKPKTANIAGWKFTFQFQRILPVA